MGNRISGFIEYLKDRPAIDFSLRIKDGRVDHVGKTIVTKTSTYSIGIWGYIVEVEEYKEEELSPTASQIADLEYRLRVLKAGTQKILRASAEKVTAEGSGQIRSLYEAVYKKVEEEERRKAFERLKESSGSLRAYRS